MQLSTLFISAITVIASVHGASIPAMDPSAPSPVALETRSYNDPNSGSNLEKRSPGYGGMSSGLNHQMGGWSGGLGFNQMHFQPQMQFIQPQVGWSGHSQMWPQSHMTTWGSGGY